MMSFTSRRQSWIRYVAIIAAVALFMPGLRLTAGQSRKTPHARKATVHRRRRHYVRHPYYRHHYARLHISSERVRQIQQALVKAGFLHETPDGIWGKSTRDAMRQYQQENGFSPTGLPEAKPLMLLGLGPHPLPPGLGPLPSAGSATGSESPAETQASVASPPPRTAKPTSSN